MKVRLLALAGVLALVMAVFSRGEGPSRAPRAAEDASREAFASDAPRAEAPPVPLAAGEKAPARDLFHYADRPVPPAPALLGPRPRVPAVVASPSPEPSPPPPPPVKLVGLVTKAGRLQAALSIEGEVWVAGVGDEVGGYTVLSVDDTAVRLRGPEGAELVLDISS
jgi:hypothetical protein